MTCLMTIGSAIILRNDLTEQAMRNGLKGADGNPLLFKTVRVVDDKRVKAAFEVRIVEMVEKRNLLSGLPFWIDRDTPIHLDPSSETYHSM